MKSKFLRLVALCLLILLGLILPAQNFAIAGVSDDGEMHVARNERVEEGGGGGGNSGSFWLQIQRRFIRDADKATGEISDNQKDIQRRDTVKEVTGQSHSPGGGPQ
jgi:hypothetical protein